MPIFLERFVLPVLAAGVIAVIVLNPFKFDVHQRVGLLLLVIGLAYFVGRTIQLQNRAETPAQSHAATDGEQAPRHVDDPKPVEPAPQVEQHSSGPKSPNISTGDGSPVIINEK